MTINKVVYDGNTLIDISDSTVTADALLAGQVAYDKDGERIVGTMVPYVVGEIRLWTGGGTDGQPPSGWMYCFGQSLSRTDYADLYDVIGTAFGNGDGSTTFNLPDFRNRFPVGAGDEYSRNTKGGEKSVTLTGNQIPSHTHRLNWVNYQRGSGSNSAMGYMSPTDQTNYTSSGSAGGGQSHENRPPYIGIYFIIYTGVE